MEAPDAQSISWNVMTHEHNERSIDWYWGLGVVAVLGAGLSIFFGNWLLAFILVIGIGSVGVLVARGPREHSVRIDARGVSLDGTLYRYSAMHSFWVERSENPRLLLSTSGVLSPQLIIPLHDERRAQNVRSYIKKYVEEEELHPHMGEVLAQLFGL